MQVQIPSVAVLGSGYWGKNLVRNFYELGALHSVVDVSEEVLSEVRERYPVKTTIDLGEVLRDPLISGVVIAVPAVQHYEIAKRCLLAGKDVFVEKPLALRSGEGRELIGLAQQNRCVLMVGHILEYHPAIVELKKLIRKGELGKIQYIYSSRLNLGKLRTEENILWSFAPHDISVILSLLNEVPDSIAVHGGSYLNSNIADATLTSCNFKSGVKAHIFVSWLHPFKEQKLTIVADKKMVVFDDLQPDDKLILYSHRIDWPNRIPVAQKDVGHAIALPKLEPLRLECQHFLDCMRDRRRPTTDGENALRVLQILEACEESLHKGGFPVRVTSEAPKYQVHSTAVIDNPCEIGDGTKVWHFSHVMADCQVGKCCILGQNVLVSPGVRIGNNVKIQNNVSLYTGVELEDDVFCGPSVVFTNVVNPRSHVVRKHEFKKTLVKCGATLGANCTVVCGVTIGCYAFVAAGAVVTRDVPDYGLVMGVPGRLVGWMCYCGTRLEDGTEPEAACNGCNRRYVLTDGLCRFVPSIKTPAERTAAA
jgi:UDP-2-acetamido-3-amino-2,3-dideoxy-glucuronate N-acetyltransferase